MPDEKAPDVAWEHVEWRVQGKVDGGGGVRVVCYLDAPTVADLLDDWTGPLNWRDAYEPTGKQGVMWCHLSVRGPDGWVTKTDVGTASDMESDKGLVSDAFKRVAMRKWGVGRNVFRLPTIRLTTGQFREYNDRQGNKQAQLTDASLSAIEAHLRKAGLEDAAAQARVATSDDPPAPSQRKTTAGESPVIGEKQRRQLFAAATEAKMADDQSRHDVVAMITNGRTKSSTELTADEHAQALVAFELVAAELVDARYDENGGLLLVRKADGGAVVWPVDVGRARKWMKDQREA